MRILVVGGGIAGLTLTIALRRSSHQITLVEAAPEFTSVGAGISIGPSGLVALAKIGVKIDDFFAKGAAIPSWDVFSRQVLIHHYDLRPLQEIYGYPLVCLTRTDMLDTLLDELDHVDVRLGVRPTQLAQESSAVEVAFSDGRQSAYDLVIGADGINSFVRKTVFGTADLRYSGMISYRGIVSGLPETAGMVEIWGERKRTGLSPVGNNSHYFYATLVAPLTMASLSPSEGLVLFQETFKDIGGPFEACRAKITKPEQLILTPICELVDHPWHRGRVLLIGDAAHAITPNLGQGGSMAIEDAVTLGDLLTQEMAFETVFERFEEARRGRVHAVQIRSRAFGTLAHAMGEPGSDIVLKEHGSEFMQNLARI
jgi:2-polyprenyl-6-methoxyphenol hydroxylase-like FAD-dependent oxidoreductase